jgi:exodeoxyribonuclease-3
MRIKLATWNINSVRLRLPLVRRFVRRHQPDILCLQELKAADADVPLDKLRALGFEHAWVRGQKGYNGVAILSRAPLSQTEFTNWCDKGDSRHVAARLPDGTVLHNFYVPAGGDVPDPLENPKFAHKLQFLREMGDWSRKLGNDQRHIMVGDLNVAPLPTDVWSHKQLLSVVSHTPVEVEHMDRLQQGHGWVDAVRHVIPPERNLYTWWSYRAKDWRASDCGPPPRPHLGLARPAPRRPRRRSDQGRPRLDPSLRPHPGHRDPGSRVAAESAEHDSAARASRRSVQRNRGQRRTKRRRRAERKSKAPGTEGSSRAPRSRYELEGRISSAPWSASASRCR